jgi:hypothetical protein
MGCGAGDGLRHNNVCMHAKMNRYDLKLRDVGKRQLYGRERASVQAATLYASLYGTEWIDSTSTKTE